MGARLVLVSFAVRRGVPAVGSDGTIRKRAGTTLVRRTATATMATTTAMARSDGTDAARVDVRIEIDLSILLLGGTCAEQRQRQ